MAQILGYNLRSIRLTLFLFNGLALMVQTMVTITIPVVHFFFEKPKLFGVKLWRRTIIIFGNEVGWIDENGHSCCSPSAPSR